MSVWKRSCQHANAGHAVSSGCSPQRVSVENSGPRMQHCQLLLPPRPAPAHALITITSCCLSQRSLRQAVPAWDAGDIAEASPARILPTQTHSSLELGALHIAEVPQGNGTGGLGKPGHQGGDRKEHSRRNARGSPRHTLLGSGPAPPRLFSLRAGSEGRPGK